MLELIMTNQFKKDLKRVKKRGKDLSLLKEVLQLLREEQILEEKYRDHALTGDYIGFRECHVQPDWLLLKSYYGTSGKPSIRICHLTNLRGSCT